MIIPYAHPKLEIMSEKFALKWNDFQSNWTKSFSEFRKDPDFADVILISEDKMKFSAHRLLLSSCSNIFKFILKENTQVNPLLYLGGVSSKNLCFILDYIYQGEVNLFQEQLDSFLESARNLEIEGLAQETMDQDSHHKNKFKHESLEQSEGEVPVMPNEVILEGFEGSEPYEAKELLRMEDKKAVRTRRTNSTVSNVAIKIDATSLTPEEIDVELKELYKKVDGVYSCQSCDYKSYDKSSTSSIRRHVEIHFEGLSYLCNLCNKEFR